MKIDVNRKKKGRKSFIKYNLKMAYTTEKPKLSTNKKRDLLAQCNSNHIPGDYHGFLSKLIVMIKIKLSLCIIIFFYAGIYNL